MAETILLVENEYALRELMRRFLEGSGYAVLNARDGDEALSVATAHPTPIDLLSVHIKELEIVGACNDEDRLDEAVKRIVEAPEQFERIVTHQFAIDGSGATTAAAWR